MKLKVYLQPTDKQLLVDLVYTQGYIRSRNQRPQLGPSISFFLTDFFKMEGIEADTTQLVRNKVPHSPSYKVELDVPMILVDVMPAFYGLEDWDQLVTNIARQIIRPIAGTDPGYYPAAPFIHPPPERRDRSMAYRLKCTYHTHDFLDQYQQGEALSLLHPNEYVDNRPPEHSKITIGPVTLPYEYQWHLTFMERVSRPTYLTQDHARQLQAIASYWHILPPRHRTPTAFLSITLEALAHNLLIPSTSTNNIPS